jgi:hypothetical protein
MAQSLVPQGTSAWWKGPHSILYTMGTGEAMLFFSEVLLSLTHLWVGSRGWI